jgi:hypothetical protein
VKTRPSGDVRERLTPGAGVEAAHELEVEIEQIRARLAANEAERKELEATLRDLVSRRSTMVANYSSPASASATTAVATGQVARAILDGRAGSDAVDLASIAPPTDKNLGAAARAQEHPARCFIRARGTACASCRKPKLDQVLQDLVLQRCGPFSSPDLADVLQLPQRPQSAARASACGYVDNARALPTYPQAQQQQPTSIR